MNREKALHPLDGEVVLVEGNEEEATQGRQLDVGRAVWFNGDCADDSLERERAAIAHRLHSPGVVDGHGKRLEHEQRLDLARLHAGHIAALVDIGQGQPAGRRAGLDAVGDDSFAGTRNQGPGLVQKHAGSGIGLGQAAEGRLVTLPIHDDEGRALRGHEAVFGEGPRVAVLISVADALD